MQQAPPDRLFIRGAGALCLLLGACGEDRSARVSPEGGAPAAPVHATTNQMMEWIETVVARGIRRAGHPADQWTEEWSRDRFLAMGLEDVALEPVTALTWRDRGCSVDVWLESEPAEVTTLPCFGVPYAAKADAFEGRLSPFEDGNVSGAIAVSTLRFLELPQTLMLTFSTRHYDPVGELQSLTQVLPFTGDILEVLEPSIEAGATGFIGILDVPWETHDYFVPYDAIQRPIPGVWLSKGNGAILQALMARGPVAARLDVDAEAETVTTHNVVGSLPGATDDWVIYGSHHDGPWASAVEDASGIALVLAQAHYWSQVPREKRPHSMRFVLQAAHVSGFPGADAYVEDHAAELERVVTEFHLEHVARRCNGVDGQLVCTPDPEVRWWFTSRSATLENAVENALHEHDLGRSLIMPPDGFPPGSTAPPTDGSRFHLANVPIVNFLTAPMYLFDSQDTVDKVHEDSLVPLTRAVVSITSALEGHSASAIRAELRTD